MLIINLDFDSLLDRDAFIAYFTPVAEHCAKHEPNTLAYELSIDDQNPKRVIIFERCAAIVRRSVLTGSQLHR